MCCKGISHTLIVMVYGNGLNSLIWKLSLLALSYIQHIQELHGYEHKKSRRTALYVHRIYDMSPYKVCKTHNSPITKNNRDIFYCIFELLFMNDTIYKNIY